jgi:PAS domain-containing protein
MTSGIPIRFDLPAQIVVFMMDGIFRSFSAAYCLLASLALVVTATVWMSGRWGRRPISNGDVSENHPGELEMPRAVIASLPGLIYVKDSRSRFLLASRGTADVMGVRSSSDLLGHTDFDFYPKDLAEGFLLTNRESFRPARPW